MTFFIQTNSADCLHRISSVLCLLFTYSIFQGELKHGALGFCSLCTFKRAFGQLQQIRKRNRLKNTFQLHNRINFLWLKVSPMRMVPFYGSTLGFHPRVPPQGPTLGSHIIFPLQGPTLESYPRVLGPGSHLRDLRPTFSVCSSCRLFHNNPQKYKTEYALNGCSYYQIIKIYNKDNINYRLNFQCLLIDFRDLIGHTLNFVKPRG